MVKKQKKKKTVGFFNKPRPTLEPYTTLELSTSLLSTMALGRNRQDVFLGEGIMLHTLNPLGQYARKLKNLAILAKQTKMHLDMVTHSIVRLPDFKTKERQHQLSVSIAQTA